ncbi:uncharacterized protein [Macrobrachium rosenbergii]|uniref:uncharacterized protein n=1 Tax=Macrobrachium rosenbergii TaxID=79674 RepID=UPI0034D507FF
MEFLGHEISLEGVCPMSSKVEVVKKFPHPYLHQGRTRIPWNGPLLQEIHPGDRSHHGPPDEGPEEMTKDLSVGTRPAEDFPPDEGLPRQSNIFGPPRSQRSPPTDDGCQQRRLGTVLEQIIRGTPQPIAFFSRRLNPTESCYSNFNRELLTAYQVVRHFTVWTAGPHLHEAGGRMVL